MIIVTTCNPLPVLTPTLIIRPAQSWNFWWFDEQRDLFEATPSCVSVGINCESPIAFLAQTMVGRISERGVTGYDFYNSANLFRMIVEDQLQLELHCDETVL